MKKFIGYQLVSIDGNKHYPVGFSNNEVFKEPPLGLAEECDFNNEKGSRWGIILIYEGDIDNLVII